MQHAEVVLLQIEQPNPVDEHHTKHNIPDEVYCYKGREQHLDIDQ